jgi:beta-glucanase (GH16 family)
MEHVGFDEGNIHSSLHSNTKNYVLGNNPQHSHFVQNLTDEFHLFSVEWSEASFIFSVDNQSFFTYSKSDDMNVNDWPFDAPFFLIINLAIGGTWGGQQGIENTIFPSRFLVEYVRLFKRN